ncbi:response regulator [Candidatus Parcubacteria bacterium]|nr:response regulator [Candidatus Parcubacteria bacterium]
MKKILLVEDKKEHRERFSSACYLWSKEIEALMAATLAEALDLFQTHKETLFAIIMDGCVNQPDELDSPPVIRHFRRYGFKGPIVANSSESEYNKIMLESGASHSALKKEGYPYILQLLRA